MEFNRRQCKVYMFWKSEQKKFALVQERSTLDIRQGNNGGYYTPDTSIIPLTGFLACNDPLYAQMLKVSLDTKTGIFYADKEQFRRFTEMYGQPLIRRGDFLMRLDMKTESILHARGYNVNQKDNLSATQRQKILSEVIEDEELKLTISDILSFLRMRIYLSQSRYPLAASKYMDDYNYV